MAITRLPTTPQELFSGNTKVIDLTIRDQDEAVVDITGVSATFSIAEHPGATAIEQYTVGAGIVVDDPANGGLTITIPAADTDALEGTYYYECTITDVGGRVSTVLMGSLLCRRNTN